MDGTRNPEKGAALIFSLLALLLLAGIGMAVMHASSAETTINANYRSSQQAFFASVAGIQEARERLLPDSDNPIPAPTAMPGAPGAVVYLLNPAVVDGTLETVNPTDPNNEYFDDELCKENFAGLALDNPGGDAPCASAPAGTGWYRFVNSISPYTGTSGALSYKWVRVTLKANNSMAPYYVDGGADATTHDRMVCWNGYNQIVLPAGYLNCETPPVGSNAAVYRPVYLVTALARGSRRVTQAEVAFSSPFIPNAAIDSQDHVVLNGQLSVNGYDYCSCDCVTTKIKSTTYVTCTDRAGKVCDRGKWAIFSASEVDPPGPNSVIVAGTGTPSGSQPIAENQPWPYDVEKLIARYRGMPDVVDVRNAPYNYVCTGDPMTCGTQSRQSFGVPPTFPPSPPDNPAGPADMTAQVTYVPGDLRITGDSHGSGILVVDGNLDIHGGLRFHGLIIVRGVIAFTGGGSDKVNIYGGIISGQQSFVDTVLGGSSSVQYDYCAVSKGVGERPPTVISFRELNY
jgi:hypothetical protein